MAAATKKARSKNAGIPERMVEGLKIRRIGIGQYHCQSRKNPAKEYTIDILANDGLGECDCEDHRFRCLPRWRVSKVLFNSMRCYHLRAVREHLLDQMIAGWIKQHKDPSA